MFFATWLSEVSDLKSELVSANAYVTAARRDGLPQLTAVDETVVEPSAQAVRSYLGSLGTSLDYPVALDTTGRVADGYGVQDQPWFALVSASGKIIWSHDGWLPLPALESAVKHAASRQGIVPSRRCRGACTTRGLAVIGMGHESAGSPRNPRTRIFVRSACVPGLIQKPANSGLFDAAWVWQGGARVHEPPVAAKWSQRDARNLGGHPRAGCFMIVDSLRCYLPETVHDHAPRPECGELVRGACPAPPRSAG